MANDWRYLQLKDVIDLVADNRGRNPESYSNEGIPVIDNYLIISEGYVNLNEVKRCVDESTYESFIRKHIQENDVLITLVGNGYGQVALTPSEKCVIIQNTIGLRCNSDNDNIFLYYLLKNNRKALMNLNIGAAQPSIKVGNLTSLEFQFPPLPEQKAIAHILGSLDDKIELNRQMNETLEAMAQALFKSWFVDFDPVIDNALAAGNAIPDELFERAEQRKAIEKKDNSDIQDLFPDTFEFTEEMGWIPKGWVVDDISTLCEKIQSGGTPRRNVPEYWEDSTIPWLTSGEVKQTIIIKAENKISESGLSNSSAKWLTSGATVVAMYGATAGQVAYIDKPLTTNQAVCGLIPKKGYQFFNYVTLSRAVAHFEGRATGSAQQNINKGMIESTRVVVPSSISSDSFEEYCEVIFSKWIKNLHENETLAKLRDTLLPKLMSGELRIPDTL